MAIEDLPDLNGLFVSTKEKTLEEKAAQQQVEQQAPIDGGFFEDLWKSAGQGWATGGSVGEAFDIYRKGANVSDAELEAYIKAVMEMEQYGPTNEQFMYQKAVEENGGGFFGGMAALYDNPGFLPQMIVNSASIMISSFFDSGEVAAATGVGAGAGAGVGSTGFSLGPLGAVTTVGGALGGGFAGLVGAMETGLTLTELLKDELDGKDFNKENIRKILEDPEAITRIKNRSLARGVTIGAVEGLTLGLSRGVGSAILKGTTTTAFKTGAKIAATTAGIEMVGGSTGEFLGQVAARQEIKGDEIFLEGIAESKGVVNVSDIIKKAVNPTKVNINDDKATEQDVIDFLNDKSLTDEEVSNVKINIENNESLENQVKNRQRKAGIGKNLDKNITDSKDREKLIDLEIERLTLEEQKKQKGILKKIGIDNKIENNQSEIDKILYKYEGVDVTKLKEQTRTSVEQFNISQSIAFAETQGKRIGKDVIVVDDSTAAQKSFNEIRNEYNKKAEEYNKTVKNEKDKLKLIADQDVTEGDGFIVGDSIVINKDIAGKRGAINVGGHEILHGILTKHLGSLDTNAKKKFINDFKSVISRRSRRAVENYIKENYADEIKDDKNFLETTDEWLTVYSDLLRKKQISFNEGVFTQLRNTLHNVFRAFGYNKEFESGIATYNFMKDYQKSIQAGKLSQRAVDVAGGGATVTESKLSRSKAVDAVNKMEQGAETQEEFLAKEKVMGDDGKTKILPSPFDNVYNSIIKEGGAINNYVKALGLSKEKFQKTIDELGDRLINYNPAAKRKTDSGEPITVGEFLMSNIGFGKLVAAKKLAIEGKKEGKTTRIDAAKKTKEGETTFDIEDTSVTEEQKSEEQDISLQAEAKRKTEATKKAEPTKSQLRKEMGIEDGSDTYNAVLDTARKVLIRAYNAGKTARQIQRDLTKEASTYLFKQVKNMLGTKAKYIPTIKKLRVPLVNSMFTADLVQMERNVPDNERIFTRFVGKLTSKQEVQDAVDRNDLPPSALNTIDKGQSVNLYEKVMPTEEQFVAFFDQPLINPKTGVKSGLRGTRKDQLAKHVSASLNYDATMQVAQEPEVAEKRQQIAELRGETIDNADIQVLSATINRNPTLKFSNSSNKPVVNKNIAFHLETVFFYEGSKKKITQKVIEEYAENLTYIVPGQGVTVGESMSSKDKKAFANHALGTIRAQEYAKVVDKDLKSKLLKDFKKAVKEGKVVNEGILNEQNDTKTVSKNTPNSKVIKGSGDTYIQILGTVWGIESKLGDAQWVSRTFNFIKDKFVPTTENNTENFNENISKLIKEKVFSEINTFLESNDIDTITDPNNLTDDQIDYIRAFKDGFQVTTEVNLQYVLNDYINNKYSGDNAQSLLLIEGSLYTMQTESVSYENARIVAKHFNKLSKDAKIKPLELAEGVNGITVHISAQVKDTGVLNFRMRPKLISKNFKSSKVNINKNKQDAINLGEAFNLAAEEINRAKQSKSTNDIDVVGRFSRSTKNPTKGISILDFDDTLATTKSKIIFTKPDGTKGTLTPEQYASTYQDLLGLDYKFDFSEFNKVVDGKPAPLLNKAKKLAGKFGTKNMFILTARPAESAVAIQKFLKENGLNIPLENITGLGNSTSEAKALWVLDKAAEGYNDFYFADDAIQNVQAVKNMLDQIDVKSKVQQARVKFSKSMDKDFNDVLEDVSGIESNKRFSEAKARRRGKRKGKFRFFVPPSHEDFIGLLYNFMGRGEKGNQHRNFFEQALVRPLNRAYRELNAAKQAIANDYRALIKSMPDVRKKLGKKILDGDFTNEDAIRVYLWDKFGLEIPGMSKTDQKNLVEFVKSDPEIQEFADKLGRISKDEKGYVQPSDNWDAGGIKYDLIDATGRIGRAKFFQEFIENAGIIFSEKNLNKIQAIYGEDFRSALEDMLYRVTKGTNRPTGKNKLVNRWLDWINGSVGATMFFNARSAVLQQLSFVNFMNFADNNVFKAAARFANQKQFWSDFATIFNSDYLKQRRSGAGFDVSSSEIAREVSNAKDPVSAAIRYILNKGFLPTQMGDSFAIAIGGSSFLRNRINTYLKQGLSKKEAETKAFIDFQQIAEATQQSARPDMISQQQASVLGRFILAFQNVTSQYARIVKKSTIDLVKRRKSPGYVTQVQSDMANVSRIMYYGAIQSMIFYGLQSALFAMMFDDDEQDEEFFDKKKDRILNGTLDSLLRGMGVGGAVFSTLKNYVVKLVDNQKSESYFKSPAWPELLQISPPIGIKVRKFSAGERTADWNMDVMKEMEIFDIDNPMWDAVTNIAEATFNVPLNRLHRKVQNLRAASDSENAWWQRVAVTLGWNKWDVGIPDREIEEIKKGLKGKKSPQSTVPNKEAQESENKEKQKQERKQNKKVICAGVTSKGSRCKKEVESGSSYCTIHDKVAQNKTGKKVQCKKIKSDKKRCKVKTSSKSGYCYYHD